MRTRLRAWGRRKAALACALLALAVVLAGGRALRSLAPSDVATIEVRADKFVREVTATGSLKAVKATPIVVPTELGRAQKVAVLASDGAVLAAGDLVVSFDPWDAQREAADGQADLAAAGARLDKTNAEGGRNSRALTLDRDVAKDALDRAKSYSMTDETLYSRNEIIESRLDRDLFTRRADVAGRKLDSSGQLARAFRALGEIEAGKARLKIGIAEKSLRSLRIVAPHDGLLVLEKNWRGETTFVGDSVWPGEKIAQIPDLSQLEAKVFVLEADAAGLAPGLVAHIAIEGQPGTSFTARVARVDPLAKPREQQSPVKYFETVLALDKTDAAIMKPGQRVSAVIRLEEAGDVIAIPRGALFEKDGKRVVYRQEGRRFVPVEVTVGRNSISRVVVASGLAKGDRIALRDPSIEKAAPPAAAGPPGPQAAEARR